MRSQFLDKIARAATIGNTAHATTCKKRAIFIFLLLCGQSICTEHIVETIKDNVMIESWIAILIGMFGIPTGLRIQHQFTITNQINGLAVGHTILVDEVGRRMMNDFVMSHQTGNFGTKNLSVVPVGGVCTRTDTTEDGLGRTRHLPILLDSIEDVRVIGFRIFITLVVVEVGVLEFSKFVRYGSSVDQVEGTPEGFCSLLTIVHVIIVGLAVRTCTQQLDSTTILGLLHLLHKRRASVEIAFAKIAKCHELISTQVILS